MSVLAYLGPAGTFGEEAARSHDLDADLIACPSHASVAAAVESGRAAAGVLAIENSLNGSVAETLDILIHDTRLQIESELVLPVIHNLVVRPGSRGKGINVIYSHPQALGQCRRFLEENYPDAHLEAALSTAEAVATVVTQEGRAGAIATARAAELHGGEVIATSVQDAANNVTRFIVIGHKLPPSSGKDRTSIAFTFPEDQPGSLAAVLTAFADRSINCSKIESRPTKEVFGEYVFLIDFEGHQDDEEPKSAIEVTRQLTAELKVMGSYPRWR